MMIVRKRLLLALGAALLLAGSASAAAVVKAKAYPTGVFTAAGHPIAAKDVLDARAIPDMAGKPSLMITLTPAAAAAIHVAQGARVPCTLDGKPLGESPSDSLGSEHVLQLSGDFGDYTATAALARRISGHDPVPDSESDE
ncbi:hypothetical protein [Sphingomonas sp. PR090111-T3T-6A]|uniref:hypothetical protein n=1 Tax=Sphingomonas sp. PR090111-T3T-6A TaxID=685778 RepID=UPI000688D3A3|nr:hypothetical protein [Sphingomonas sp. PR090111-T3T-6A]